MNKQEILNYLTEKKRITAPGCGCGGQSRESEAELRKVSEKMESRNRHIADSDSGIYMVLLYRRSWLVLY